MKIEAGKKYHLRGGLTCEVFEIRLYNSAGNRVTFPVKGHILRTTPTGRVKRDYNIWKLNGQAMAVGEHMHDIIEEV